MKNRLGYFSIKSRYVIIIFIIMLTFIVASFAFSITLFALYNQYMVATEQAADEVIFGVNTGILASMFIALVVMIPIAFAASKRVMTPLIEMKEVAGKMTKGDLTIRMKEGYQGEIGQLADALNILAEELSKTINTITVEKNLLTLILNSMSDGLLEFDADENIDLVNKPFFKLFEISSYEDLDGEVSSLISKVSKTVIQTQIPQVQRCDFKDKCILISGSPVFSENENTAGSVLLFKDVTEGARLDQTRREYVANVSHELRSPLTAMKGLIIPLKEEMVKDEEERKRFYEIMYSEVERLNRMVNDLFELSRLQTDDIPFEIHDVNVQNILYDQQDKFALMAKDKDIDIVVESKAEQLVARGNLDRISQVLTIFIDNAIKYSEAGSEIKLSAKTECGRVLVSACNTGSFIKDDDLPYVFDRFYKADKAHKDKGAGLGLSIAKEIVDKMNGNIYASSDGESKTCFSFDLEAV